jgi:hypothetical protein
METAMQKYITEADINRYGNFTLSIDGNLGQKAPLTFNNHASYIEDGGTATLQMLHFIYFFNKYKY